MDRFCDRTGRPRIDLQSRSPRIGRVPDYRLDFNYYSKIMQGGAANLEPSPGDCVEGILFDMSEEDMTTIDEKEKAPSYFHRTLVNVVLSGGMEVSGVVSYVACDDKKAPFSPPTREYKETILEGAKAFGLSGEWIRKLESLPVQIEKRP